MNPSLATIFLIHFEQTSSESLTILPTSNLSHSTQMDVSRTSCTSCTEIRRSKVAVFQFFIVAQT
ncbi:hypothetical protein BofuT4_uP012330.1 [Botrytis cinerea T4]|uniref:Uncharacterized protein n=1 Tax=Botryotinia fuckeliana (strain T4) TaxID=999810 RepID=G2XSC0_BOTF4|nr:hypothetical protein BofuT4_uP012330.1 [Botrytis cinerea T4]